MTTLKLKIAFNVKEDIYQPSSAGALTHNLPCRTDWNNAPTGTPH